MSAQTPPSSPAGWLAGGGEMGKVVRSKDWSQNPLGPIDSWPDSLRTTVNLALASNFPISLAWGPRRIQIYNDGYWPICGGKHPEAMGQDFKECWFSAWPAIGAAFESASAGRTAFLENQRMFLDRHGYLEETFFTFSFSPIRDETGRVAGLFHPVTEMTAQSLAERRLSVLREVSDASADARTVEEASELILRTLAGHQLDVPFALLYLLNRDASGARLSGLTHLEPGSPAAPERLAFGEPDPAWPLAEVVRTGEPVLVERPEQRFGPMECGPYPESPQGAMVLPISVAGLAHPLAVLVAAVSPRRALDPAYRTFYLMLQEAVTNALVNARSYEEEKKRAEALAEIDRAKTTFFSNVSHEFRTPLTLMLGPLEDALAQEDAVSPQARERLAVAHRNSLRLLKLVNSLLDFSRIEAGRVQASYEPSDLAALTADLASNFRSACEKAELRLEVDCPPLPEPVYVDRDMWEKVVLNLLSNAFKFTLEGGITVSLRPEPGAVVLRVSDTGSGIPAHELPRLFERFHRVEGTRGRTHEGSGIGLALVQELVKLHGGSIEAESEPGRGTTFTVSIPRGSAHLPPERIGGARTLAPTATGAAAYVEEALRWLPGAGGPAPVAEEAALSLSAEALAEVGRGLEDAPALAGGRILLADDNADMREYVRRLLAPRFEVSTANDGEQALAAALASPPDLVLSDVMMPGLDGFALLRALRSDERTRTVPVILLSARAGEEARVEGLGAGADDYLVKPFTARELLARVETHLRMARAFRQSEAMFRSVADTAPAMLWITDTENRCTFLSRGWYEFTGQTEVEGLGFGWTDAVHPDDRLEAARRFTTAAAAREAFSIDYRLRRADGEYRWAIDAGRPRFDAEGHWLGYIGSVIDVHERKTAEEALRESQERLRQVSDHVPVMIGYVDREGIYRFANQQYYHWFGLRPQEMVGRHVREVLGPSTYTQRRPYIERVLAGEPVRFEGPTPHRRFGLRDTELAYVPDRGPDGQVRGFYVHVLDITERKRAEEALRGQGVRLRLLWEAAGILLTSDDPDTMLQRLFSRIRDHLGVDTYFNFMVEEGGEALRLASYYGISPEQARAISRLGFGEAICGLVAQERRPIVATGIQDSKVPREQLVRGYGIRAYACNPLLAGGRLLGTLSFASRTRDSLLPEELEFLETISHYVTAAYQRLQLIAQLQEADRRKNEFLAMLAHELRNPLAPVRSAVQVLRLKGPAAPELNWSRDVIDRQVGQMSRLIDDLLDVSRISRDRLELRKERVELKQVVEAAVETSRPLIAERDHALEVSMPDEPVPLHADLTRLAQVFSNLLNNAARYTPRGGRIRLVAEGAGDEVTVSVRDTGAGIPADQLPHIFDMFARGNTPSEVQGGLGIGLTLARRLVEMHGGGIVARSEGPGRGSEFVVRLPVSVEAAAGEDRTPVESPAQESSLRILVVDDNVDAADAAALMLEMLGNDTRTAYDGRQGLEVAEEFRPDVVLLDIGLPGLNGLDVARRLRQNAWGRAAFLVAVTGWGQDQDRQRSSEAGFDEHLVKPVDPQSLMQLLNRVQSART